MILEELGIIPRSGHENTGNLATSHHPSGTGNSSGTPSKPNNISSTTIYQGGRLFQKMRIPTFNYISSPFYSLTRLCSEAVLIPAVTRSDSTVRVIFKFTIEPEDYTKIKEGSLNILLLAGSVAEAQKNSNSASISFPPQTIIRVNQLQVQENLRGVKNKPGTTRPADLSRYLAKSALNVVDISISEAQDQFLFSLYYSKATEISDIVDEIKNRPHIKKEDTIQRIKNAAFDDEIEELSTVLSLRCPLSYARIQVPTRSIHCDHIECFDLTSFLQLQQQATTWTCPICNKHITYEDLAVDEYLNEILMRTTAYDISEIEIAPDSTWKMPSDAHLLQSDNDEDSDEAPEKADPTTKSSFITENAIVVTLDSDGEELEEIESTISSAPAPAPVSAPAPSTPPSSLSASSAPSAPSASSAPTSSSLVSASSTSPQSTSALVTHQPSSEAITTTTTSQQPETYSREELFSSLPSWSNSLFSNLRRRDNPITSTNNGTSNTQTNGRVMKPPLEIYSNSNSGSLPTAPPHSSLTSQGILTPSSSSYPNSSPSPQNHIPTSAIRGSGTVSNISTVAPYTPENPNTVNTGSGPGSSFSGISQNGITLPKPNGPMSSQSPSSFGPPINLHPLPPPHGPSIYNTYGSIGKGANLPEIYPSVTGPERGTVIHPSIHDPSNRTVRPYTPDSFSRTGLPSNTQINLTEPYRTSSSGLPYTPTNFPGSPLPISNSNNTNRSSGIGSGSLLVNNINNSPIDLENDGNGRNRIINLSENGSSNSSSNAPITINSGPNSNASSPASPNGGLSNDVSGSSTPSGYNPDNSFVQQAFKRYQPLVTRNQTLQMQREKKQQQAQQQSLKRTVSEVIDLTISDDEEEEQVESQPNKR